MNAETALKVSSQVREEREARKTAEKELEIRRIRTQLLPPMLLKVQAGIEEEAKKGADYALVLIDTRTKDDPRPGFTSPNVYSLLSEESMKQGFTTSPWYRYVKDSVTGAKTGDVEYYIMVGWGMDVSHEGGNLDG